MVKRERELKAAIALYHLDIVEWGFSGKGHFQARLRAPNGAEQTFTFNKDAGDVRAAKNDAATLRRFSEANIAHSLAGQLGKVVGRPATDEQPPPIIRTNPTVPKDAAIRPLTPTEQAELERLIHSEETPMQKQNDTTPNSDAADRANPVRLSSPQFFKLCQWMLSLPPEELVTTRVALAEKAPAHVGFPVSRSSVVQALEATGVVLTAPPPPPRGPYGKQKDRTMVVARALAGLYQKMGEPVPAELTSIINKT